MLGGGPAGIAAAARGGRSTLLIERYGFLGGAGTAAGLANFCGLHARVDGEHRQVVHGLADDILDRLGRMNGLARPHMLFGGRIQAQAYDISAYKIAADQLLLASGAKLLFHAFAVGATRVGASLDCLLVETKSGRGAIKAQIFIDCSGDGDLAAWAGAPYEVGDAKGGMLYPSTMYRIGGVDPQKAGKAWETVGAHARRAVGGAGLRRVLRHGAGGRHRRGALAAGGHGCSGPAAAAGSGRRLPGRNCESVGISLRRGGPVPVSLGQGGST